MVKTYKIPVIGSEQEKSQSLSLSLPEKTGDVLIAQYVHVLRTNARQGTASTKSRSEVAGTTKKMYKQKGTGNARHGSAKAPIFKGGGVVGGPTPKNYASKISKKQKSLAMRYILKSALSAKRVNVLDSSIFEAYTKTKDAQKALKSHIKASGAIAVLTLKDANLKKILRNIDGLTVLNMEGVSPIHYLSGKQILFSANSLDAISLQLK